MRAREGKKGRVLPTPNRRARSTYVVASRALEVPTLSCLLRDHPSIPPLTGVGGESRATTQEVSRRLVVSSFQHGRPPSYTVAPSCRLELGRVRLGSTWKCCLREEISSLCMSQHKLFDSSCPRGACRLHTSRDLKSNHSSGTEQGCLSSSPNFHSKKTLPNVNPSSPTQKQGVMCRAGSGSNFVHHRLLLDPYFQQQSLLKTLSKAIYSSSCHIR